MKTIKYVAGMLFVAFVVVGLCSFTCNMSIDNDMEVYTHAYLQGTHCNYTVGCGCSGFAPIQHEEVYKLSYCKRCGHHKKYHK